MGEIENSLSPARMGDGFVYWVELPGLEKPLVGLADRRSLEELEDAFIQNERQFLRFSGVTIPGDKTSTGKPIHVGAGLLSCPDSPVLVRYDDAFAGLPGGGDEEGDDDRTDDPPQDRGGGKPPIGLGSLRRA